MESTILRIEVSSTSLRMELSMSETNTVSPLRQRMIEDMAARKLNPHTQRSLSTPEQKCIGSPQQKYINDAGEKSPRWELFSSLIRLG